MHPALVDAARDAIARWGVGAGASHLIVGHAAPHAALEDELAAFVAPCAGARALTFSSGYLANLAILTALAGRDDVVFADRLNHACLNDGALLSRATFTRYAHGDVDALVARLAAAAARRRFIVTDAVFSMDGDVAPLPDLLRLAEAFDAWLVVDDAHGFGVLGRRPRHARALRASLGADRLHGDARQGGRRGRRIRRRAPERHRDAAADGATVRLHDGGAAAARRRAVRCAARDPRRRLPARRLTALIAAFRASAARLPWTLLPSSTPIQPLIVGDVSTASAVSDALLARGILVPAIRPPTVPAGTARLRVSLSAAHSPEDVDALTLHSMRSRGAAREREDDARSRRSRPATVRRSCCCTVSRCTADCSRRCCRR